MNINPKITIIMPAYNVEDYIEESLLSVCNQTYDNIEIIIVNDGSTDSTGKILEEISKKHSIKIINTDNKGVSSARNTGIANATGEYIGFVDADDTISSTMFEKMMKKAKDNNACIVICDYKVISKNKTYIHKNNNEGTHNIRENLQVLDEILLLPPACWNKIYKKELFNDLTYPNTPIAEDLMLYSRLIMKSDVVTLIDEPLHYYRLDRTGNATSTRNEEYDKELVKNYFEKYKELLTLNKNNVSSEFYVRLHKHYYSIAKKIRSDFTNVKDALKSDKKIHNFTKRQRRLLMIYKSKLLKKIYLSHKR